VDQAPAVTLNYGKSSRPSSTRHHRVRHLHPGQGINTLKRKQEEAPAEPPRQEVLLTEIRDLLKQQKK
jgi:hypothetical protein